MNEPGAGDGSDTIDAIEAVALLDEPRRRELYEVVAASAVPLGRDDAAAAVGVSRELAAFHLDRLVAGGLLETEFRRRSGRTGPGAGRPAKLYRRVPRELAVSLPPRAYATLAEVFASALSRLDAVDARHAVGEAARLRGSSVGAAVRREAGARPDHGRLRSALVARLREAGFEPRVDPASGDITLCNCPYAALSASQRDLTCGMNKAWADGLLEGLRDARLDAELAPAPERCCVVFRETAPTPRRRALRRRGAAGLASRGRPGLARQV